MSCLALSDPTRLSSGHLLLSGDGLGFVVRGRKVKSRDCALASDLVAGRYTASRCASKLCEQASRAKGYTGLASSITMRSLHAFSGAGPEFETRIARQQQGLNNNVRQVIPSFEANRRRVRAAYSGISLSGYRTTSLTG